METSRTHEASLPDCRLTACALALTMTKTRLRAGSSAMSPQQKYFAGR